MLRSKTIKLVIAALLVVVVIGGLGSVGCARPAPSFEGQEIALASGWNIHHIDQGSKGDPVILFVHGLGGSSEYWVQTMASTAVEGYRCLAVDMLGFGLSDKPEDFDYSIEKHVEILREFLALKKVDKVIYVGHSWGGSVGMGLLQQQPDLVEKIVLLDSTLDPDYFPPMSKQVSALKEAQFSAFFQILLEAYEKDPERLFISVRGLRQSTPHSIFRTAQQVDIFLQKQEYLEIFKELEIPHYYIFGTRDEDVAKMVEDQIGSAPWLYPIEYVKHSAMVEDPARFCSILGKILAE